MKNLFVLLSLIFLVGCNEPTATLPAARPVVAPVADPIPEVDTDPAHNTLYVEFDVQEPTAIEVRVERWVEGVGFDSANPIIVNGVVDSVDRFVEYTFEFKCRVYFTKAATSSSITVTGVLNGDTVISQNFPSQFWVHEQSFLDLQF